MQNNSRTKNSFINVFVSISYQFIFVILSFISRKIFINVLGIEYLGINGLFANILAVFSLSELGISSAMIYSMYSAIAKNDTKKLNGLINYYKKLYTRIAISILVIGILLIPFLEYIVNLEQSISQLEIYYLIFLLDSVLSYFFIYRTSIVIADQKEYKLKYITIIVSVIRIILQILLLICTHSYIVYLVLQVVFVCLENVIKSYYATKWYPFIKEKNEIDENDKREIWENIRSMFCYKLGGVILNNTDNILISIIVGTITVGIYSNYSMVIVQVATFSSLIFTSIQASIGSLNTDGDTKKNYFIFKVLNFISFWIYGFSSVCFFIIFNDFISLVFGANYLLDNSIVIICIINYYLQGVLYPIWCFRHTTSLFKYTKYTMFYASVINIVLSIILGIKFGLLGILIATAISRLITTIWYEPVILFKKFFNKSSMPYFKDQILKMILIIIAMFVSSIIASIINFDNLILTIFLKMFICIIIPNLIFFLVFRKTEEFNYIYKKISNVISNKIK